VPDEVSKAVRSHKSCIWD